MPVLMTFTGFSRLLVYDYRKFFSLIKFHFFTPDLRPSKFEPLRVHKVLVSISSGLNLFGQVSFLKIPRKLSVLFPAAFPLPRKPITWPEWAPLDVTTWSPQAQRAAFVASAVNFGRSTSTVTYQSLHKFSIFNRIPIIRLFFFLENKNP